MRRGDWGCVPAGARTSVRPRSTVLSGGGRRPSSKRRRRRGCGLQKTARGRTPPFRPCGPGASAAGWPCRTRLVCSRRRRRHPAPAAGRGTSAGPGEAPCGRAANQSHPAAGTAPAPARPARSAGGDHWCAPVCAPGYRPATPVPAGRPASPTSGPTPPRSTSGRDARPVPTPKDGHCAAPCLVVFRAGSQYDGHESGCPVPPRCRPTARECAR